VIDEDCTGQVWRQKSSGRCFLMLRPCEEQTTSNEYEALDLSSGDLVTSFGLCYWAGMFADAYERVL